MRWLGNAIVILLLLVLALVGMWLFSELHIGGERVAGNGYHLRKINVPTGPVWIGVTEVSFGQFCECLLAGADLPAKNAILARYYAHDPNQVQTGEPLEPIVDVSLYDALGFASWLTYQDHIQNKIKPNEEYTLPSDLEWSQALRQSGEMANPNGFPPEKGDTPRSRNIKAGVFLWGTNDETDANGSELVKGNLMRQKDGVPGSPAGNPLVGSDGFLYLAPVNQTWPGIRDDRIQNMIGNVREWCRDGASSTDGNTLPKRGFPDAVLRGGSWHTCNPNELKASFRGFAKPEESRDDIGFRLVLRRNGTSTRTSFLSGLVLLLGVAVCIVLVVVLRRSKRPS